MATRASRFTQPVVVGRVVYGTITVMTVLVIYDGWQNLRFVDVVAVIVGPVLAMFLSHAFAGALAQQVALGRRPTNHERLRIVASESRFLLLAVPPLAIVSLLTVLGVSLNDSIRYVTALGALSLGFWGGLAGRRSGSSGWRLVLAVLAGLAVGGLVLALQIVLQPGKAASGGGL